MIIKQALLKATQKLKQAKIEPRQKRGETPHPMWCGVDSSALDADILLSFVLKKSKEFLYTYPEKKLTKNQLAKFNQLINRRLKREPVAYLINRKEFYGLDFYVDKNVLIPRPLTESLVEQVIKEVGNKKATIADIGTGSGCIAIALKKHLPQATIYATDISPAALKVAKKNAKKHRVKIKFLKGDLLKPFLPSRKATRPGRVAFKKIDIIIANLPYLIKNQIKNELKYEPKTALLGGDKYIKELLRQVKKLNPPSGGQLKKIFLETGD